MKIGDTVAIIALSDEEGNAKYLNQIGEITGINTNRMTGNTRKDPLFSVYVEGLGTESFWREELQVLENIYTVSVADVQEQAKQRLGRYLDANELRSVQKAIESALSHDLDTVVNTAIDGAFDHTKHMFLLLPETHGVYIPQRFAVLYASQLTEEQREALSSPENPEYWETWSEVEEMEFEENSRKFRLYLDGDLWQIESAYYDRVLDAFEY